MSSAGLPDVPGLPEGSRTRTPDERDLPEVVALLSDLRSPGDKPVDVESVTANLVGVGSWTRRQRVVRDADGRLTGWAVVHDRAAGRTNVGLVVARHPAEDQVARALLGWLAATGADLARFRGQPDTQLDASPTAADVRTQGWLAADGYRKVREWLQMVLPVTDADAPAPPTRPGVVVRRVREHPSGLPVADDVQTVHRLLEESFADHFNSYRESFGEFVQRLREDPWHRWDHWWVAELEEAEGEEVRRRPAGVLISSVAPPDAEGRYGSYVDYIGVHRRARGRGVAKALLATVVADAAERGRDRVTLEVDADSPTGADGLYRSLGYQVDHVTQSWHRQVDAAPPPG